MEQLKGRAESIYSEFANARKAAGLPPLPFPEGSLTVDAFREQTAALKKKFESDSPLMARLERIKAMCGTTTQKTELVQATEHRSSFLQEMKGVLQDVVHVAENAAAEYSESASSSNAPYELFLQDQISKAAIQCKEIAATLAELVSAFDMVK